jgi:hypothetical protein
VRETPSSFDYLFKCSQTSLEGFELARLNRIANLRKELRDLVEEWVGAEVEARLSRWLLEERRTHRQAALPFGQSLLPISEPPCPADAMLADTSSTISLPFSPAEAAFDPPADHFTPPPGAASLGAGSNGSPRTVATSHLLSRYIFFAHAPPSCLSVPPSHVVGKPASATVRIPRRESA